MSLDDELQPQHRSPGALRARRLHERRRQGEVYVTCILRHSFVAALIGYGWLSNDEQDDRRAVAAAFRGFTARAYAVARNGGHGGWYIR